MVKAARYYDRVTQVGTQQRSMPMNNWASDLVKNGDLGNTAVDKLGFAVPVQVTDLSVTALNTVEPGANRDSGETKGIKTSITDH